MVAARLREVLGLECELLKIVTTGDRQAEWNLEQQGGKGLFTGELEQHLLEGRADLAVHSTKDLPGDLPAGLVVAGYLPRADVRDVLVTRRGVTSPRTVATSSPRRRLQLQRLFPDASFTVIRGNVDTRLRKIAAGEAEGTVLAAAGLARLDISFWPGLDFRSLTPTEMVPAVGQGAIAVETRGDNAMKYASALDRATAREVDLERALQAALGGGCHTAFGAYATTGLLHFFHERSGLSVWPLLTADLDAPAATATRILRELQLI
jgi:hydroxymethylbilane synthase